MKVLLNLFFAICTILLLIYYSSLLSQQEMLIKSADNNSLMLDKFKTKALVLRYNLAI